MSIPHSGFIEGEPRLHYLEWNPAGSKTLVLVHGNSANAWWWSWIAAALSAADVRLIALDLRGHGDSAPIRPVAYSPLNYANDIECLIRRRALDRPVIAGHSIGGMATLAFAVRSPELARAAIAIDIPVTSSTRRNRYLRHLKALPTVIYPDLPTAIAKFRLMPNEGGIPDDVVRAIACHSVVRTADGGYTMKFDRESFFGSDGLDAIATIGQLRLPLLLVRAGESRILTAEAAARAVAANSLVRLVTIPAAHHHLPIERPEELAQEILNFMRCLSGVSESF